MRKFKLRFRVLVLFLSGLILLQSCSAYKTRVTMQQAAQEEKAVKIITVDDDTYKNKYIVYENRQFYGVKDNPGEDVKFPILVEEVEEVLIKKGLPWWAWGLIAIGAYIIVASIYCLSTGDCYGV
ncbi:hypothetical protein [Lentiprolixibacter aurantiacus]|uniref:Uncharacterized protein n=1 Tax=Lentiprolixibacter aurantiacus TaxID=2993939 RepID=A0AAE3MLT8_9FLAO|nr:hypothetical protein [Lentiprolixibacter aurantiacus]MCX2719721.1 hypothetical protein [Lentiprolixibacter aurantiacus]